jgi:uncharacterized membrane-anchored protein
MSHSTPRQARVLGRFLAVAAAAALALVAGLTQPAGAKTFKEMFPGADIKNEQARAIVEAMDYQQGVVSLGSGGVKLDVPPKYYVLGPVDAQRVLTGVWGNPPNAATGVLGMILPAVKMPIEDTWGAIIRFDDDGYVSDEDAGKIDYADLLKSMQEGTAEASAEREKAGFGTMKLVGWASQPYYDAAQKKLHWAKELEFNGKSPHTLNYDVRALGRRGVLKINFVADMGDLPVIRSVIPDVLQMVQFEPGSRYADYVPGTDKVAAYGIGGLIAGKVLAKAGLLAALLLFLKKGWIIVVLGLGGLLRLVGGWFRKKT